MEDHIISRIMQQNTDVTTNSEEQCHLKIQEMNSNKTSFDSV